MHRLISLAYHVCFASSLLGIMPVLANAQSAERSDRLTMFYADPSQPDIAGFWRGETSPLGRTWTVDGEPLERDIGLAFEGIPYTPEWGRVYTARRQSNLDGKPYGEPHFDCWPRGAMHAYNGGNNTMTITQTPGRVLQIFEEQSQIRNIFVDGRPHPRSAYPDSFDYRPTSMGHSIGHWEGDTLVVDTIGVRKEFTMGFLAPHSDVFHVIERITRLSSEVLEIDITVDDAKALEKPMRMLIRYVASDEDTFIEDFCNENNRNVSDADGFIQTILTPRKGYGWDLPE